MRQEEDFATFIERLVNTNSIDLFRFVTDRNNTRQLLQRLENKEKTYMFFKYG